MLFYLLPLVFFYAMYAVGLCISRPGLGAALGALPMLTLALLRGQVGVDTPNYVGAVELLRDLGEPIELFEPLFERLLLLLSYLPIPPLAVLAIVSTMTALVLMRSWWRLEPAMALFSGVFAMFFVDMTMNGLRYGLAFALVVASACLLVTGRRTGFWLLVGTASMIQISSGLMGLLLFLLHEFRWRAVIYSGLFGFVVLISFSDYLLLKLLANEVLEKPGALSGLSSLGYIGLVLVIWSTDPQARKGASGKILTLLLISAMSYGLTQISYAGLRVQLLVAFLANLAFACHLRQQGKKMARNTIIALIVTGMLFGGLRLRNIAQSEEGVEAPFVPYKFFWEPN